MRRSEKENEVDTKLLLLNLLPGDDADNDLGFCDPLSFLVRTAIRKIDRKQSERYLKDLSRLLFFLKFVRDSSPSLTLSVLVEHSLHFALVLSQQLVELVL